MALRKSYFPRNGQLHWKMKPWSILSHLGKVSGSFKIEVRTRQRKGRASSKAENQSELSWVSQKRPSGELSVIREVMCTLYCICDYERIII